MHVLILKMFNVLKGYLFNIRSLACYCSDWLHQLLRMTSVIARLVCINLFSFTQRLFIVFSFYTLHPDKPWLTVSIRYLGFCIFAKDLQNIIKKNDTFRKNVPRSTKKSMLTRRAKMNVETCLITWIKGHHYKIVFFYL